MMSSQFKEDIFDTIPDYPIEIDNRIKFIKRIITSHAAGWNITIEVLASNITALPNGPMHALLINVEHLRIHCVYPYHETHRNHLKYSSSFGNMVNNLVEILDTRGFN